MSESLHGSAAPLPSPASLPPASDPGDVLRRMLSAFIRGNGFYVISMVLMVYGCHRLVRTLVVSGAEAEFARTALSLSVLQAYEILVIATAALVVRRLGILGDAGTLLLVEAALLLDPTFFANSFLTMPGNRGLAFNALCLALVPAKLAALQAVLGLRFAPRTWGAFLLAAAIIYLAPWPLDGRDIPFLSLYGYYYALGGLILGVALLLPPLQRMARFPGNANGSVPVPSGFATPVQQRWIPRVILALPLLITAVHYVETARVYTLAFYPANAAPLLLAGAVLIVANGQRDGEPGGRRLATDLLAGLALLLSLSPYNTPSSYDMQRPVWAVPDFIASSWPLVCAGLGVAGLYAYTWLLLRDRGALRRLAVLFAAGALYGIWRSGAAGAALRALRDGLDVAGRLLHTLFSGVFSALGWAGSRFLNGLYALGALAAAHPDVVLLLLLALALWLAYRFPRSLTWSAAGFLGLIVLFRQFPGGVAPRFVEFLESVILMGIVLSHRFRPETERGQRLVAAALVCVVASLRLHSAPGLLTAGFLLLQIGLLSAGARYFEQRFYGMLAAGQILSGALLLARIANVSVSPGVLAIGGGLALFVLAVYVTFNKQRLLDRLQPAAPVPPSSPLPPPLPADDTILPENPA